MAALSAEPSTTSRIDGGRARAIRPRRFCWAVVLVLSPWGAALQAEDERPAIRTGPPAWMHDAYWYRIPVSAFQNADPSKDHSGAKGDGFEGFQAKLPYLKALGVNALWITGVFDDGQAPVGARAKMRHVAPALAAANSNAETTTETTEPTTDTFTAADRVFLRFLQQAHEAQLRVVVGAPLFTGAQKQRMTPARQRRWWALTRRWMDPDANGDPFDGVDGWAVSPGSMDERTRRRWRAQMIGMNPDAVLLCDFPTATGAPACGGGFDAVVSHDVAKAIRRFFAVDAADPSVKTFADELTHAVDRQDHKTDSSTLLPLGTPQSGRFVATLAGQRATLPGGLPETLVGRARLAIAMQHFLPGNPLLDSGDEVGLIALYRMFTHLRAKLQPLHGGDFSLRLADKKQQLMAFSRTSPGNEVIFVMNYGDQRRNVTMRAGKPGQLIGVLHPHLQADASGKNARRMPGDRYPDGVLRLPVTGTRQFVNRRGEIRFRVGARSIRVVLINDKEPR